MNKHWLLPFLVLILLISGCKDDEIDPIVPDSDTITETTLKVNQFVFDVMNDIYLWNEEMPRINLEKEEDSERYFYKLLHEDDHWSYITDDYEGMANSFAGIEKTFGYSLAFSLYDDEKDDVFAIIEYVYPNSPAADAGLKRGDIIKELNGAVINKNTYMELLNSDQISINLGEIIGMSIHTKPETYNLTAQTLTLDPILYHDVINYENRKIGYLVYNQYIETYNNKLNDVLTEFQTANIDHLILDLRFNLGGDISAARHLCSCIAPQQVVANSSTLITLQWNKRYQEYFEDNNQETQLSTSFISNIQVNLNLNEIHILTSRNSASASELTITGLDPYMDVTLVGDTTFGKYTGSITLRPEYFIDDQLEGNYYTADYIEDFNNWALQPIVMRYANIDGVTNFKDGFAPDYYVFDELIPAVQLGDVTEPLLQKALADITGSSPVVTMKKAQLPSSFKVFDRGFTKFDEMKTTLNVGDFEPGK